MRPLSMMDAFRIMGPAFLVSVALVDPGNWATAIEAGSKFGYELVWVVVASNLIAILLQTLAARLGIVTGKHLAQVCRESYPPQVCALLWVLCEISIVALDLTMLLGTAIGLNLLLGWPLLPCIVMTSMDALLLLLLVPAQGVKKSEALTVGLLAVVVACFLVDLLVSRPPLGSVVSGLLPRLRRDSVYTAVSLLGANVMPHNFYLHSALVSGQAAKAAAATGGGRGFGGVAGLDSGEIRALCLYNFLDIGAALGVALVINVAVLLVSAATFHSAGVVVHTLQAAHDLMEQTLSSSIAPAAFGTALLCAGQLSTFTGTIAGQVVLQGFLNIHISTWLRRLITRTAAIIPAAVLQYVYGDRGTYKFLLIAQVVLALQLPVTLIPLIKATSSRQLMGRHASSPLLAGAAWAATGLVFLANLMLFVTQMLPEVSSGRGILDKDGPLDAWIDRIAALAYSDPLRAAGLIGLLVAASAFLALQLWMIVTPLRVDAWAALSPVTGWGESEAAGPAAAPASPYGSKSGAGAQAAFGDPWFGGGGVDSSCSSAGRGSDRARQGQGAVRPAAQPEHPQRPGQQQHPWTSFAWPAGAPAAPAAAVAALGNAGAMSANDVLTGSAFTGGWVVPRWAIATVIQSGPQPYNLGTTAADAALLPLPWRPRDRYHRRLSGFLPSEDDDGGGSGGSDSGSSSDGEDESGAAASLAGRTAALGGPAEAAARVGLSAVLQDGSPTAAGAEAVGSQSALPFRSSVSLQSEPIATSAEAATAAVVDAAPVIASEPASCAAAAAAATAGTLAGIEPVVVGASVDGTGVGARLEAQRLHGEVVPTGMLPPQADGAAGASHPDPAAVPEAAASPEAGRHAAPGRPKHPVARGTRPKFARVLEDFWATFYDAYGQTVRRARDEAPAGPSLQDQQSFLPQGQANQDGPAQTHRQQQQQAQQMAGVQQQAQGQGQEVWGGGRGGGAGRGGIGLRFSAGGTSRTGAADLSPLSPLLCGHTDGSHLCMGCSQALFGAVQQCVWALEQLSEVEAAMWGPWPLQLVLPPENQTFPYHRALLLATRNGDFLALQALCSGTYSSSVDHTRLLASMPLIRVGVTPPQPSPTVSMPAAAGQPATTAAAVDNAATVSAAGEMSRRSLPDPGLPGIGDAPVGQTGAWAAVPGKPVGHQRHQTQQPQSVSLLKPGTWWSARGGHSGSSIGGGEGSSTSNTQATAETRWPTRPRPQSAKRAACLPISSSADAATGAGESARGTSSGLLGHLDKAPRLVDSSYFERPAPQVGMVAPTISMWCVFGPAAFISFGLWSIFTLAQWCTADSRPAHWGQYAAVLNRLQGVLRDARLDVATAALPSGVAGAPAAAGPDGGGAAAGLGPGPSIPIPAAVAAHQAAQGVPAVAESPQTQQQQAAAHQPPRGQHRGRQGAGLRGAGRGVPLSQSVRNQHPQQMGQGRQQHGNQQQTAPQNQQHHQQQHQPALPDTALQLCTAHLELLRWELLQQLEGMEAYVLERRGPADTAAGQVAFPKAKEIIASVMRRYRRRLGAGPHAGATSAGQPVAAAAAGGAARPLGATLSSSATPTSIPAGGGATAAAEQGAMERGESGAVGGGTTSGAAVAGAAGGGALGAVAAAAAVLAGAPARRAAALPDSAWVSYSEHPR